LLETGLEMLRTLLEFGPSLLEVRLYIDGFEMLRTMSAPLEYIMDKIAKSINVHGMT
jgi:hypothetical protein